MRVRMIKPSVNLSDVAAQAGVSRSTVSKVLNNKLGNGFSVSEEVRQRIITVARKLNYRPNLIAQSLSMQSTRMISVLGGAHALSDLGNIYQTVVNNVTEIIDAAHKSFDVTVDMSQHNGDTNELPAWRIDGAIILAKCTPETMKELEHGYIPYVVVNGPCKTSGSCVVPDDVGGTRLAIHHLFELGHRRIAYAGPRQKHLFGHSSITDRHDTYVSELTGLGLKPIESPETSLDSAAEFLESAVIKNGATAIVAYGHMEALNLLQAAHTLEISIPEQLSLMCFCEEYANSVMSPGLTFVDVRSEEMGRVAARLLLKQIEKPEEAKPEYVKVDEKLVIRESTAPVKS